MSKHFIAMAGIHGCMPNYCASCDTYHDAVDSLISLHDLGRKRAKELRADGYIELNMQRDGNEYAEITECDCDNPAQHNDG